MKWVILITAADGSESAIGTPAGNPFATADAASNAVKAAKWDDSVHVRVLPIYPVREPLRYRVRRAMSE